MANSWALTVGGEDLTSCVTAMDFKEIASSSQGQGTFTVNGSHASIVQGAAVTLTDANGKIAWEGKVSVINPYGNSVGVIAAPLSAQMSTGTTYGNTNSTDIATIAAALASQTSIPWGGPAALGMEVGSLSFSRVDSALTTLAYMSNNTWRVQNGNLVFVGASNGLTKISLALQTTSNTVGAVHVKGGADAATRMPLDILTTTIGNSSGPTVYVSYPEIAVVPMPKSCKVTFGPYEVGGPVDGSWPT